MSAIENCLAEELQTETQGYSGSQSEGMDLSASYDRMCYLETKPHTTDKILRIYNNLSKIFQGTERTRLVTRFNIQNIDESLIQNFIEDSNVEVAYRPNMENPDNLGIITIAENKEDREVGDSGLIIIRNTINSCIERNLSLTEDFNYFALSELEKMRDQGFSFTESFNGEEVYNLWKPFEWEREDCFNIINTPASQSHRMLGLRNSEGSLIALALFADGETTEWAVAPEYQGQGLITPLLIGLNCRLLNDGVKNIYAELRYNRSIGPAIRTGMEVDMHNFANNILANHVSIGNQNGNDAPDNWNTEKQENNNVNMPYLRSFAIGHVNPDTYSERIRRVYC